MHHNKYVQHLEKKVESLENELLRYRENSRIELNSVNNTPNQYIDLNQIKKIEPKQSNKQSTKNINKSIGPMIRTDNLNAKTAEILKTSPNNMMGANRQIMAVNINNVSKYENSMEKHLFRQGGNPQIQQTVCQQSTHTPNINNVT